MSFMGSIKWMVCYGMLWSTVLRTTMVLYYVVFNLNPYVTSNSFNTRTIPIMLEHPSRKGT